MGVDGDLASIIREIVQFLESLYEVELPSKIENARVNLLQRSKTKLSTLPSRGSASPEPYLDMNAGKGFLLFAKRRNRDVEIEEYVGVEEQPAGKRSSFEVTSHQDYYETFQEINGGNEETTGDPETRRRSKSWQKLRFQEDQAENKLCEIYKTFTPAKTLNKAHKSGPLYQKVERKPFGFVRGNMRPCWIGLVGSHLLIHGSEDDKQPPEILCIRGYSARPAPTSVARDPERAKSAFEIFCPGNKTLQFVARNPNEMDEWLEAVNRAKPQEAREVVERPEYVAYQQSRDFTATEEKYQDVGEFVSPVNIRESPILSSNVEKPAPNDPKTLDTSRSSIILGSTPPILPVRTSPRRLPSLPSEAPPAASYEPLDDGYEDDDIYHKIEDFHDDRRSYENVNNSANKITKNRKRKRKPDVSRTETYDDAENEDSTSTPKNCGETYDDVRSTVQTTQIPSSPVDIAPTSTRTIAESPNRSNDRKDRSLETYDDVHSSRLDNSCGKTTTNEQSKYPKSEKNPNPSAISPTKIDKNSTRIEKSSSKGAKNSAKEDKNHGKCEKNGKSEKSTSKSSHKRSFLDRVRHRKDSPKKDEKKRTKENNDESTKPEIKDDSTSSSEELPKFVVSAIVALNPDLDLPTYDDVSELAIDSVQIQKWPTPRRVSIRIDETSDYNCPPPPRPIYSKPPSPAILVSTATCHEDSLVNEIYDDIGSYGANVEREIITSDDCARFDSRDLEKETVRRPKDNCKTGNNCWTGDSGRTSIFDNQDKSMDSEHYQTPRADSLPLNASVGEGDEELYDDIAVADFRARQCQDPSTTSACTNKANSTAIVEKAILVPKKSWNRFSSGKKCQTSSTRHKSSFDPDEVSFDESLPVLEKQEATKLNKFQKLINKMESTLGNKPSAKSVTHVFNKTQSE